MTTKRITQREAQALGRRVALLEEREEDRRTAWVKDYPGHVYRLRRPQRGRRGEDSNCSPARTRRRCNLRQRPRNQLLRTARGKGHRRMSTMTLAKTRDQIRAFATLRERDCTVVNYYVEMNVLVMDDWWKAIDTHLALAGREAAQPKLIGWRMADYTNETDSIDTARNWSSNVSVLPIFDGDPNTKLVATLDVKP